jgi:hypothetical protein
VDKKNLVIDVQLQLGIDWRVIFVSYLLDYCWRVGDGTRRFLVRGE